MTHSFDTMMACGDDGDDGACCVVWWLLSESRCSRCRSVWYCSRECQRNDWTRHKSHCAAAAGSSHDTTEKELPGKERPMKNARVGSTNVLFSPTCACSLGIWHDENAISASRSPPQAERRTVREVPSVHPSRHLVKADCMGQVSGAGRAETGFG